uniref:hypothetical protein n=1 Tax=Acinetobacter tandoii TaxID=202954 RepID=UPI003F4919DB
MNYNLIKNQTIKKSILIFIKSKIWIGSHLDNKKARHPVGLFRIGCFGMTPVVPAFSFAVFSYSYLEHPALYVPII